MKKKYSHVRFEERCVIEKLLGAGLGIRAIADVLDRSPNTIAAEIHRNRVDGVYVADKANHKAYAVRWRAKKDCLKVAMDAFLTRLVIEKLEAKWSPRQISGRLKRDYGIQCSAKAIYRFAESRCLEHLLFWGWNKRKGGRKKDRHGLPQDGRVYIDERPEVEGAGHLEMDFVVSKQSSWALLVIVDRLTKRVWIERLPNRKRDTIRAALSKTLKHVVVRSITTDNDIAFTCWKELQELLQARIYFTHPYHSWEKGLVENTNRWIRCFVPKRRDLGSVTEEELEEIHAFLNDRPRECLGFVSPRAYYSSITCPA
ncbi:MAG: IS30 family transposase [Terriglobia bacterium]